MWWLFLIFNVKSIVSDGQFECGQHGRFEYCIDEIPGCVIGCHCHPGYFFDTDSKICEPNSRLTQNFRRTYTTLEPFETFENDITTSQDHVDKQADEITKTADDLGDWLYNQFFKTVENQVINNTKKDDSLTRRSNSHLPIRNPNGKFNRKRKNKSKKKSKKTSLRRKLLRITENDSAFASSSNSNSDSSESSSSDSESSDEISQSKDKHINDNEHGHKKIVIINKKPKPQLPSFIFLPNMDTAFYPPIGLPPPPALPMYPMVPVPPMLPFFPYQGHSTDCDEDEVKTTITTTTTTVSPQTSEMVPTVVSVPTAAAHPTSATVAEETIHTTIDDADTITNNDNSNVLRASSAKKRNNKVSQKKYHNDFNYGFQRIKSLQENRKRNKMRQYQKNLLPPWNKSFNKPIKMDYSDDDDIQNNEIHLQENPNFNPHTQNVDFKYISDLIHQGNINKSDSLPPIEYNPMESIEIYKPTDRHKKQSELSSSLGSRRIYSDDSYYTDLGRQIASMIRTADSHNKQINVEFERIPDQDNQHLIFNNNSPRSFYERSVRSPIKFQNANKNKFDYLKRSNEVLFDIENRVEIIASTVPTLSLQEIENIVNVVETARQNIQNKNIMESYIKPSNDNINMNMWEHEKHTERTSNIYKPSSPIKVKLNNNDFGNNFAVMGGLHLKNYQKIFGRFSPGKQNETNNIRKVPSELHPEFKHIDNDRQKLTAYPVYPQNLSPFYSYRGDKYFQDKQIPIREEELPMLRNPTGSVQKGTHPQKSYFRYDY